MSKVEKKVLFNEGGEITLDKRQMIGGNSTNINDFNNIKYQWVSDWYRQAMNNFWIPEEINMNADVQQYRELEPAERVAYDKILSFLIFLDSIQTNNLPFVAQYITASEVVLCLTIQAFQEAVHSQSYSYMLDTICSPDERTEILYQWRDDEHLLRRNRFIGDLYMDFQNDQSERNLVRTLVANYILEGIYFYSGFMFFYNLARNNKMPGSEQEIAWGRYVIGDEIPGLNQQMVTDYIQYLANLRSRNLDFGNIYEQNQEEPASMSWISQYSDANMVKTDFFEAKSTAYAKSTAMVDDL